MPHNLIEHLFKPHVYDVKQERVCLLYTALNGSVWALKPRLSNSKVKSFLIFA